jgi:ribose transport system permease protein
MRGTDGMRKKVDWQKLLAPGVLVLLYVFLSVFGKNFFSWDYIVNILNASYYIGFMAIGVTFVIITGGIDLSIGTNMMCGALIGGAAYNMWGWNIWAALALAVIIPTIFGLLNGLMIAYLKLPPFIANPVRSAFEKLLPLHLHSLKTALNKLAPLNWQLINALD